MMTNDGYIITDLIKDSNSYSYVYTYALTSNPLISNSNNINLFTFKPSYNSLAPPPPPTNNTQIKEFGVCDNACYQCIEPYTYSLGAFVSLCVVLAGIIIVKKINFKNIFKLKKRPKKNRSYRRPINNHINNDNNDLESYGVDFGINSQFV